MQSLATILGCLLVILATIVGCTMVAVVVLLTLLGS
jgi:hypothetical protein